MKTAIVTGGAKGIGRSVSERLAADGWNLILCGRDESALHLAAKEIESKYQIRAVPVVLDLSRAGEATAFFTKYFTNPTSLPQALVCNAGDYGVLGPLAEINFDEWKKSFDLNFFSVASLVQEFLKRAKLGPMSGRRKIVIMGGSGLGGSQVWPAISAYGCAKAALYRLTEIVHEEVYSQGIDINCVAPGAVKTGITDQAERAGAQKLGNLYEATLKVKSQGGDSPELAGACIARLLSPLCDGLSGRLISAKWDGKFLDDSAAVNADRDLLRLRRIDGELFGRVSK